MIDKILYSFYYMFIMHLPHSRYISFINKIRLFYVCNILGIMKKSKSARFQNNIYIGGAGAVSIGKDCQINEHFFIASLSAARCPKDCNDGAASVLLCEEASPLFHK